MPGCARGTTMLELESLQPCSADLPNRSTCPGSDEGGKGDPVFERGACPFLGQVSMGAESGGGCVSRVAGRVHELERDGRTLQCRHLSLGSCNISVMGNVEIRAGVTERSWKEELGELLH